MTGLLKGKDAPLSVRLRRSILGKFSGGGGDGMQEGAPGFTTFNRPSSESARPKVRTPLRG